jgi:hypothetical protein
MQGQEKKKKNTLPQFEVLVGRISLVTENKRRKNKGPPSPTYYTLR